ncbi:MAG: Histidine-tRNA ligase [Parcubacteria group bacterium GW2011_GWA2_47_16]|nr:MAG: Histidine-tRNA ligase [Parcubacteria group bacterium GW2011_GWA2_47_16]
MPPTTLTKAKSKQPSRTGAKKVETCLHKNIDLPAEIALYYGFALCEPPVITKEDTRKARNITEPELRGRESTDETLKRFSLEEKVALVRMYHDKKLENGPQPVMFYFGKPIGNEDAPKKPATKERSISLEVMGAPKSIAEALLIKTALEILKEEGFENLSVHVNSVGDRDTVARFSRELSAYYRKNIEELPAHCRQLLKKDVFGLLSCKNEKCRIIKDSAPKSMSFLSEDSREHFKEVLEYLEFLEIPYEIDHFLVGNRAFSCQTIFEIHDPASRDKCEPLAIGVRYANIAKKLGFKRDLPGIGIHLAFKAKNEQKNIKFLKPKIYFIQLGFDAKLKSLKIIETLRKEKIPMYQAISHDRLVSQLGLAESMKIPYTIIMGQKEAIDDTVIVRDMENRSQDTVKIVDLPKYLKKL